MNEMIPTKLKFDGLKKMALDLYSILPIILCFFAWLTLLVGFLMEASKLMELQHLAR